MLFNGFMYHTKETRSSDEEILRRHGCLFPTDEALLRVFDTILDLHNHAIGIQVSEKIKTGVTSDLLPFTLNDVLDKLNIEHDVKFSINFCGIYPELWLLNDAGLIKMRSVSGWQMNGNDILISITPNGLWTLTEPNFKDLVLKLCVDQMKNFEHEVYDLIKQYDLIRPLYRYAFSHLTDPVPDID